MSVKASATGRTDRHGPYIDNEIQDIYIYWPQQTANVQNLTLQAEEVEEVDYWHWHDYCKRSCNGDITLVPRSDTYRERFFPWLQSRIDAGR